MSGSGSAARAETAPKKDLSAVVRELERRKADDILTAEEVATLTGSSLQTVYNWCNRKERPLKHEKPGREYRIRVEDLSEFLRAKTFRPRDVRRGEGDEGVEVAAVEGRAERIAAFRPPAPRPGSFAEVWTFTPAGQVELTAAAERPITIEVEPERADLLTAIKEPADARRAARAVFELALEALRWRRAALTMKAAEAASDRKWAAGASRELEGQAGRLLERSSGIEPEVVEMLLLALQESAEPGRAEENTRAHITLISTAAACGEAAPTVEGGELLDEDERQRLAALDVTTETLRNVFDTWAAAVDGAAEAGGAG